MTWIVDHVREHPAADFHDVQRAGQAEGCAVHPIAYGTARKIAGLPLRPPSRVAQRRPPAPARRDAEAGDGQGTFIDRVVTTVRRLERERNELRDAIHEILGVVREHLKD